MEKVIFDTNAYRYLTSDKNFSELKVDVENFKSIEKRENISALMHPIVIKELLYHVAGKRDKMHRKAIKALKAMFIHCGDSKEFSILADFDLQMNYYFYNVRDTKRESIDIQLGEIVAAIAQQPIEKVLRKYQFNLKQIRDQVNETELFFKNLLKGLIAEIDPTAKDWTVFENDVNMRNKALKYFNSDEVEDEISMGYILQMHENLISKGLIVQESQEQLLIKSKVFKKIYKAPIQLYKEVLKKFIQPNFNFEERNRENFIWDIHLMFLVGDFIEPETNSRIYFVTSDREIKNAASKSGFSTNVFTYPEYIEYITRRKTNLNQQSTTA
ncbi:hypothetical protein Palpr_0313 [Paludibacter propionicigenes WB4]|uniref:DUF4935 domain-containing protein n=1 Tax=Paludibacter propionicigenes (strain DSM 17365 / JCM 13257 / WB4) TaxID=694427 RepID=E4T194_PALPW|nr:hypothetical protein [Paludibacter propionicigenes]ADQ78475.1 hypothetical protein Palpr_0313 [Paludibacter propionicigenes WB4]